MYGNCETVQRRGGEKVKLRFPFFGLINHIDQFTKDPIILWEKIVMDVFGNDFEISNISIDDLNESL